VIAESGDSVRTPRNDPAWPGLDKDLLSAAREECLEALQKASEVVGEGVIRKVRGDSRRSGRSAARTSPHPVGTPRPAPSSVNRKRLGSGRRRGN
jgi:hypothetical protein